ARRERAGGAPRQRRRRPAGGQPRHGSGLMRFGLAHKLTSYAMVACAYLAVATSGELSPAALVASLAGIAASWWWEQPRIDRGQRAWPAVALVVFAYHALSVLAGADVLLVGAEFLLALLTIKLFMRRAPKDYLHVYVLS